MLTRLTKAKLVVFVMITVSALTAFALNYVNLPEQFGIGRYPVDVELVQAGGLYPRSAVTYRGVEVGKVASLDLTGDGSVIAKLEIDDSVRIPRESIAEVRSQSAMGEQYINFVPPARGLTGQVLSSGSTVPVNHTRLPTTTNAVLAGLDDLLGSIPADDLRTLVRETGTAARGAGANVQRLVVNSRRLQIAATDNLPQTTQLIDDLVPVLGTQHDLAPSIRSYARNLDALSTELVGADSQLRGILAAGAPFMRQVASLSNTLRPVLPGVLADLADTGQVLRVYRDHIEHLLIVAPALIPTTNAVVPPDQRDGERWAANLWFKVGLDPPVCTRGFENAGRMRDPSDLSPAPVSKSSWCKVAPDDPRAARGARNQPCPNGGTGATAAQCGLEFDRGGVAPMKLPRSATPSFAATPEVGRATPGLAESRTNPLGTLLAGPGTAGPSTLAALLEGLMN